MNYFYHKSNKKNKVRKGIRIHYPLLDTSEQLGMPLRKNFGSGRSLQSLFHFVTQRISAATLHANPDLRFMISDL
jgi:hypothetical protein